MQGKLDRVNRFSTIGVLALVVVIALGASYGILNIMERRAHASAKRLVSEVVAHIDAKMAEVETVTMNESVKVAAQLYNPEALEQLVRDFVEQNSFVYGSTVAFEPYVFPQRGRSFAPYSWITPDNKVHSRQLGTETDYYQEEWYAETKLSGEPYWCEPYFDEGGAKVMMCTFSVPLKDNDGNLVAVMTADVGLDDLEEYISTITPDPDTYIILRSKKGNPLINDEMDLLSSDGDAIIIKGMVNIGWTVELMMTFNHLLRGDSGIFLAIGIILLIATLFVYFVNRIFNKLQQKATAEYQKKLQEALLEAQSANRAKTVFLNSMSHDIRTPMNAILGYTSMAQKHIEDTEKASSYLEKIGSASNNLLDLVNQVLDMSKIESGKVVLSEDPADVVVRAYEMTEIISHSAEDKNIKVETRIDNVKHPKIYADSGRMNQMIMNILGNAVKYTPEGGRIVYTVSESECDRTGYATYTFTTEDSGIGMSKEYVKTIFEPFTRENTSTVSKIQGTGLGMAIVKRLTDLMGGQIQIESEPGKGTKIAVSLPLRLQENAENAGETPVQSADYSGLNGKRVLLVEDNEMNCEITTMLLEEQGLIVETADDGDVALDKVSEAVDKMRWDYYDFILMDIQMPRMNGYEAAAKIRELLDPLGVHIPIIALSANAFVEDIQKCLEAGMDDHIAKPIDTNQLWATLAKFLEN